MKKTIFLQLILISYLNAGNNYNELLFNGNCITCHHPTESISAPSAKILKERYMDVFPKKEDFINYMSNWVIKPNKEKSIMIDQIEKYELMPELGYDLDTLKKISAYLYDTEFKN